MEVSRIFILSPRRRLSPQTKIARGARSGGLPGLARGTAACGIAAVLPSRAPRPVGPAGRLQHRPPKAGSGGAKSCPMITGYCQTCTTAWPRVASLPHALGSTTRLVRIAAARLRRPLGAWLWHCCRCREHGRVLSGATRQDRCCGRCSHGGESGLRGQPCFKAKLAASGGPLSIGPGTSLLSPV